MAWEFNYSNENKASQNAHPTLGVKSEQIRAETQKSMTKN